MTNIDRRAFLATGAVAAGLAAPRTARAQFDAPPFAPKPEHAVVISSANTTGPVERAMAELARGARPIDAVVEGVTLYEDDPSVTSVGYGGLPNEDGVVQLDASVMDGPSHKAGAVAAIENIRNPAKVALEVLRRTDHVLLVGDGARRFAVAHGFEEQDMLTPKARQAWLRWKRNLNPNDDWLDDDQTVAEPVDAAAVDPAGAPFTYGTIHCAAVDQGGNVGACTTTSGLSYKIPGRVGDSPIIGAGMYVDNAIGAAGATGRGEALIQSCGAFQIVQHMGAGDDPTEACLKVLRWIAEHTKRPSLLNENNEPNFGATVYAVRKDGRYGSATMHHRPVFTVHDAAGARTERCTPLFE